jgi:hypothetical protein
MLSGLDSTQSKIPGLVRLALLQPKRHNSNVEYFKPFAV